MEVVDELLRASYVYDDEGAEDYMKDLVLCQEAATIIVHAKVSSVAATA